MNFLRPVKGGYYDADMEGGCGAPLIDDLPFLFDADSHHHKEPCGIWCPRRDCLIVTIPDSEDGGPQ